jgi:hypothetical protein
MSYEYPKARWWWEALIDWMIANPGESLKNATAQHGGPINMTYATVMNVVHSDLFKTRLAQRKAEVSVGVDLAIIGKTTKIAVMGLDAISEVLVKKRDQIPLGDLQTITGSALDRLGYGAKPPPGSGPAGVTVNVGVQQVSVDPSALRDARNLLAAREAELASLPPPPSEKILNLDRPDEEDALLPVSEGEIVDVEALDVSEH